MAKQLGRWRMNDGPAPIGARPVPVDTIAYGIAIERHAAARDQLQPSLLARLHQDGQTGEWSAIDGDGNPCVVKNGPDGLEIFAPGEAEDRQGDPDSKSPRTNLVPEALALDEQLKPTG